MDSHTSPRLLIVASVLAVAGSLVAGSLAAEPLAIVVSIPPQAWLVEQVGGDRVEVDVLLAPGESPVSYRPADAQVTRLMRADLYFRIGVPFERGPWFDAIRRQGGLEIIDVGQQVEAQANDPHIWLSPKRLRVQAEHVADALARLDGSHRSLYRDNLARLEDRLESLDEEIRARLRPYAGRAFLVFHPSWGYFAADYGLVQLAIEHDGKEPSDRELTALLARAREEGIGTVFVSPQIRGQGARAVAETLRATVEILDPLAVDVAANLAATARKLERSFAGAVADD